MESAMALNACRLYTVKPRLFGHRHGYLTIIPRALYRHRNDPHHPNDLRHRNDPQSPPK